MRNLLLVFSVFFTFAGASVAAAPQALAASPGFEICDGIARDTNACKDVKTQEGKTTNPVIETLKIALNILAFIAGAAAVIILIVNGLRLILSNGDSNGVSSARSGLIYVLVGLAVVVFARVIVVFVLDKI